LVVDVYDLVCDVCVGWLGELGDGFGDVDW